jgi:hypothetical protein
MLGTILKDPGHSKTFKSTYERPEIKSYHKVSIDYGEQLKQVAFKLYLFW